MFSDMRYHRARLDDWIATDVAHRYPELVKPFRAALDAYDRITAKGCVGPKDLRPIIKCICSNRTMVVEEASWLFAKLTVRYQEARDALADMANSKLSHVRTNAIICLGRRTPRRFTLQILRKSLADKSPCVREKAADWALRLDLLAVASDLEEALAKETNKAARNSIDSSMRLLRDGYILDEPSPDGTIPITVFHNGILALDSTTTAKIAKYGIKKIVGNIRQKQTFSGIVF